jgi:uncharacterized protein YkwD
LARHDLAQPRVGQEDRSMDSEQFDSLTRFVSTRQSRRTVLGAVLGAALLGQFSAALDEEELAMLTLINDYRVANGLDPLAAQSQLMEAAASHSRDQATLDPGDALHDGSDGSDPEGRIERAGYTNWASWGENVHWEPSDGSANAAFVGWQNSGPHNAQMLSTEETELGIARAQSESGGWYWTAVFGRQW